MGLLHQVVALVAPKKANAEKVKTECYHTIQKPVLFDGISRQYQPKDEEGEKLPPEAKAIQAKVGDLLGQFRAASVQMFDTILVQETANCAAKADIVLDGKVIASKVPVTYLMFLEKQLTDISTFLSKLPTLDPAENWQYNEAADQYATPPSETTRTKKVPKAFVKYEATKEHPAQVETFHEDILVGYWRTVKFSGAIPAKRRNELLERARRLREAVTDAREEANKTEAKPVAIGDALFDFLLK